MCVVNSTSCGGAVGSQTPRLNTDLAPTPYTIPDPLSTSSFRSRTHCPCLCSGCTQYPNCARVAASVQPASVSIVTTPLSMDELSHLQNTAATFDEVSNSRPSHPLNFPDPEFSEVTRVNASVHNPITDETGEVDVMLFDLTFYYAWHYPHKARMCFQLWCQMSFTRSGPTVFLPIELIGEHPDECIAWTLFCSLPLVISIHRTLNLYMVCCVQGW